MRSGKDIENELIRLAKEQAPDNWSEIEQKLESQPLPHQPLKKITNIRSKGYYKIGVMVAGFVLILSLSIGVLPHLLKPAPVEGDNTSLLENQSSQQELSGQENTPGTSSLPDQRASQDNTLSTSSHQAPQQGVTGNNSAAFEAASPNTAIPDAVGIEYKNATVEQINQALGINLSPFKNIPSDLTVSSYELAYVKNTNSVLHGRITYKSTKGPSRSIVFTVEKGYSQTKNPTQTPDMATDASLSNNANSSVITKSAAPPYADSGAADAAASTQTVYIHINGSEIGLTKTVNQGSNGFAFYSNIETNDINYAVNAQNLSLEEMTEIFTPIVH